MFITEGMICIKSMFFLYSESENSDSASICLADSIGPSFIQMPKGFYFTFYFLLDGIIQRTLIKM